MRNIWLTLLLLAIVSCNNKEQFRAETARYHVTERIDKHEDKDGKYVEGNQPYDHNAIYLALTRGKMRIYARCGAACDMQPAHDYECTTTPNGISGALPPIPNSDLVCKDGEGRSVFVHALSQQ